MGEIYVLAVDQTHSITATAAIHWVLLIYPRSQSSLLKFNAKPYAFDLCNGSSRLLKHPDGLLPHTLVKIHIADLSCPSTSQLKQLISKVQSSNSEEWLLESISMLQQANLIEKFSGTKFMGYANDAVIEHRKGVKEGVERRDYLQILHSSKQVKDMLNRQAGDEEIGGNEGGAPRRKSFMGFWVSSPGNLNLQEHREVTCVGGGGSGGGWGGVRSAEDPYGGLM